MEHPGLLRPDNNFDAPIDLLLLNSSRRWCDESRFAKPSSGDSLGRNIHRGVKPGLDSFRPAPAEFHIVYVGPERVAMPLDDKGGLWIPSDQSPQLFQAGQCFDTETDLVIIEEQIGWH